METVTIPYHFFKKSFIEDILVSRFDSDYEETEIAFYSVYFENPANQKSKCYTRLEKKSRKNLSLETVTRWTYEILNSILQALNIDGVEYHLFSIDPVCHIDFTYKPLNNTTIGWKFFEQPLVFQTKLEPEPFVEKLIDKGYLKKTRNIDKRIESILSEFN